MINLELLFWFVLYEFGVIKCVLLFGGICEFWGNWKLEWEDDVFVFLFFVVIDWVFLLSEKMFIIMGYVVLLLKWLLYVLVCWIFLFKDWFGVGVIGWYLGICLMFDFFL